MLLMFISQVLFLHRNQIKITKVHKIMLGISKTFLGQ